MEKLERMAGEVLYVCELAFSYTERPRNEWIPITKKQYYRAVDIIKKEGSRLNRSKNMMDDSRFLLDGNFIELNGSYPLYEGKNPRLIHIMNEDINSSHTTFLIEKLDLPLPR